MKAMKRNIFIGLMLTFLLAFTGCGKDKTYDVEFIVENETITTSNIKEGEKVSKPEDPSKTGYNFVGWYNGDTKFDFNSEIKGEIDLVARFEAINYTITLDLDGGEIEGETSIIYNIEQEITLKEPTKAGLVFAGWQEEGSNNILRTVVIAKGTIGNKSYKAIYKEITQLLLYKDNELYKMMDGVVEGKVLDYVDNLDETTAGWFKDSALHNAVAENEVIVPGMALYTKSVETDVELSDLFHHYDYLTVDLEGLARENGTWNGVIPRKYNGMLVKKVELIGEVETPITFPSSLKEIKVRNGNEYNFVVIPDAVNVISNVVVKVTGPLSIEIAKSTPSIPEEAFKGMNLTAVTFEEGTIVKTIEARAFYDTNLTTITIPNSVKTIGEDAFNMDTLTSLEFKENSQLESIGEGAFGGTKLTTITIPSSVKTIGDNAFYYIETLTSVTFKENSQLETIGYHAFYETKLTSITIPSSVKTIGAHAFYFVETLTNVIFGENSQLETIENHAFTGTKLEAVTIPASVTTIEDGAFSSVNTLTSVTFKEGSQLETIGKRAFEYAILLETIEIPSSVTSIGGVSVEIRTSDNAIIVLKENTEIGAYAFVSMPITKIEFEENSQLEKIEQRAFFNTKLTSITIPSSVKIIEDYVFDTSIEIIVDSQEVYEKISAEYLGNSRCDIHVLKTLSGTNSYLKTNYNKTESGDYYVYTKKAN